MRLHHAIFFVLSILAAPAARASDVSWIFLPGYYTHSPITGQRVAQYEPERPSLVPIDPSYQESGYRHQLIQLGTDHLNIVQTWGAGTAIRPYGEWERPYRPGATPYGPWGNPQGPWTLPYQSWQNPYRPHGVLNGYGAAPYGPGPGVAAPMGSAGAWQAGPQAMPGPAPPTYSAAPPPPAAVPAVRGQEL